jgi:Reverse transcriptase (RNA-dependent DNA polymerase)
MTYVHLCVSLVAVRHWPLHQLDVKNAFLNGILEEEVYMIQLPGFVVQEEAFKICRLRKSLYGLKQSPPPSLVWASLTSTWSVWND